ncbi:MAG TPA: LptF/LptG family permease, partial [Thiotrichales bacterium]|nr:LptF/LptG family permease [Thiotrichales bacterium]
MVLDRYITRSVLTGTLVSMLVLLAIFVLVDFVAQLKDVGTGDYDNWHAMAFVLMQLPQRFYELSPSILLLGGILSLGTMAANSELIVMRASGISVYRITRAVLQAGLMIAVLVALMGEYVVPYSTGAAKTLRAEAMEKKLIVGGYNDIWARDG